MTRLVLIFLLTIHSLQAWGQDCSVVDINLSTQEEVDNFQVTYGSGDTCDRVAGTLTIDGDDISDIDGLAMLTSIGGDLYIDNNPLLSNINGLTNLTGVEGMLYIYRNPSMSNVNGLINLSHVETLSIGNNPILKNFDALANLTSVERDLYINEHATLTNIDGLANLTNISSVIIYGNDALTDIDALSKLTALDGNLRIVKNTLLNNIDGLINITRIEGEVNINENPSLIDTYGLTNLTHVGRFFELVANTTLPDIDGLVNLSNVGGKFEISTNYALTEVDGLENLTNVGGDLFIYGNSSLGDISGLANLRRVGRDMRISRNSKLGNCSSLAPLLGWPNGPPDDNVQRSIDINLNTFGCNSIQEILDSVSGPTAPSISSYDLLNGKATLTFLASTTSDSFWAITGYYALCLADEVRVFQNHTNLDIPDESFVVSPLTLSEVPSKNGEGINIEVKIGHPSTNQLALFLKSPSGTSVKLWDEAVSGGTNLIGSFPTTLEPAESLGAFDGEDLNGEWQLTVADGVASHTGALNSWGITVRDKVTVTSKGSPITLTGLSGFNTYSCTVSAVTGLGLGPASNTVVIAPPPPDLVFSGGFED